MNDPWLSRRNPAAPPLVVVGCMNFGTRTPERESRAIIEHALERGLRCFDTANVYGNGASERVVGKALAGVTDARIATKVGLLAIKGKPEGLAPKRIGDAVAESLERLGRSAVDVLYFHVPDRSTLLAESLAAVGALQKSGAVHNFGASNHSAWELLEMMHLCDELGVARPKTSQVLLNLAIRQIEIEYARFAARHALHTTVYNPLAGGLFARPLDVTAAPPPGSRFDGNKRYLDRYWSERLSNFATECRALAEAAGTTLLDVAYGWLVRHPAVDSILIGPATVAHLDAAIDACARPLPDALMSSIARLQRSFDGTDATYAR